MRSTKPLVLFDVGGVLIQLGYARFMAEAKRHTSIPFPEFQKQFAAAERDALTGSLDSARFIQRYRGLGLDKLSDDELHGAPPVLA